MNFEPLNMSLYCKYKHLAEKTFELFFFKMNKLPQDLNHLCESLCRLMFLCFRFSNIRNYLSTLPGGQVTEQVTADSQNEGQVDSTSQTALDQTSMFKDTQKENFFISRTESLNFSFNF